MNSKRILWVCCDIIGTFTGNQLDQKEVLKMIDAIRVKKGLDMTLFSFVSSNSYCDVRSYVDGDKKHFGLKKLINVCNNEGCQIALGPQIFDTGYYVYLKNQTDVIICDMKEINKATKILVAGKLVHHNCDVKSLMVIDDVMNCLPFLLVAKQIELGYYNDSNYQVSFLCSREDDLELYFDEKIDSELAYLQKANQVQFYAGEGENITFVSDALKQMKTDIHEKKRIVVKK